MKLSPHLYRKLAPANVDQHVVDRVIEIETRQSPLRVRSIYSLRHLAHLSGSSYKFLRKVVERSRDPYEIFSIRKRDNLTLRSIAAPSPELNVVQRWLLDEVFSKVRTNDASFAYEQGLSAGRCAAEHLGARWLIKLDLRDFFHQTDERDVYHLLRRTGYGELVSFEVSRIVTRSVREPQDWLPAKYREVPDWRRDDGFPYAAQVRLGYLPQGAPTSGVIANILASRLDHSLVALAAEHRMTYTRYADDLAFSSVDAFSRPHAEKIIGAASGRILEAGYTVNTNKTRILAPGSRLEMLGVLVDGPKLRLPARTRSRVERHLRGLEVHGVNAHLLHCGFRDLDGMRNHISGLIAYCYSVDPELAKAYFARLSRAFPLPGLSS